MGIGAMFVLLVLAVILLPMIVRYIDRMEPHYVAGFQDMMAPRMQVPDSQVSSIPAIGSASKLPTWRPDRNTDYLCRSPNEDGQPCDEGSFCDGTTQKCFPNYVGGDLSNVHGYFS